MSIFYFFLVICFSDFGYCFDKGMMVMVWIKFNKILLSNMISFYIMFSGGQFIKLCGFVVVYFVNKYIVIFSMKNKQWKFDIFVLLSGWFNFVFIWWEVG